MDTRFDGVRVSPFSLQLAILACLIAWTVDHFSLAGAANSSEIGSSTSGFQSSRRGEGGAPTVVTASRQTDPPAPTFTANPPSARQYHCHCTFAQTAEFLTSKVFQLDSALMETYQLRPSHGDTLRIESITPAGNTVVGWSIGTSRIMLTKTVLTELFLDAAANGALAAFAPIPSSYTMTGEGAEPLTDAPLPAPTRNHSDSSSKAEAERTGPNPLVLLILLVLLATAIPSILAVSIFHWHRSKRRGTIRARHRAQRRADVSDLPEPPDDHDDNSSTFSEPAELYRARFRAIELWREEASVMLATGDGVISPVPQPVVSHDVADPLEGAGSGG